VLAYAALLPAYAWHRLAVTVAGRYQTFVAVCELLGALNVLLLGAIRFRVPWAEAVPLPPETPLSWDESRSREEEPTRERVFGPFDVHILVPVCNEPDDVVFGTVRAALALQHPLARRLTVWLLDDGAVATREGVLHSMASPGL
jgi:cellulose synthase/poly-beta-1,6-N-acetylglucosamine synthase-like glycosyltransferase